MEGGYDNLECHNEHKCQKWHSRQINGLIAVVVVVGARIYKMRRNILDMAKTNTLDRLFVSLGADANNIRDATITVRYNHPRHSGGTNILGKIHLGDAELYDWEFGVYDQ